MRLLVICLSFLGVISGSLLHAGPMNPCAATGINMGARIVRKCEDLGNDCSPWTYLYSYVFDKTCYVWCCYDAGGGYVGTMLSNCGPEAPAGCCNDGDEGSWIVDPPTCPP